MIQYIHTYIARVQTLLKYIKTIHTKIQNLYADRVKWVLHSLNDSHGRRNISKTLKPSRITKKSNIGLYAGHTIIHTDNKCFFGREILTILTWNAQLSFKIKWQSIQQICYEWNTFHITCSQFSFLLVMGFLLIFFFLRVSGCACVVFLRFRRRTRERIKLNEIQSDSWARIVDTGWKMNGTEALFGYCGQLTAPIIELSRKQK